MKFPKAVKSGSSVVRIYRTKHHGTATGFVYQLAWTVGGVRRLQQFVDLDEAMEEARLRAAQLASGRIDAATISKPDRDELQAARQIVAGKGQLLPALREWAKAYTLTGGQITTAAEAWAARNHAKVDRITVADAVQRFIESKRREGVDVKSSYLKVLPTLTEAFGDRMLPTLTARELTAWLESRHPAPVTRNTVRKRIVTLWHWARKQGYLPRDAQTEADQVERAREPQLQIGILRVADYARALALMHADHREHLAAAVLAGFCGLRRSELHAQLWADVMLDRGLLRVSSAKRNTPAMRLVPLCPAAIEWLMLCERKADRVAPPWALDRIRAFCRAAEPPIPCPENGFRHSYISHRIAQTGDVAATALEAGNSPQIIFRHYRELVGKSDGEAWFAIRPGQTGEIISIASAQ
jgi:integrase